MPRILVVDDERDVHYSFQRLFARKGIDILSAESGEEALVLADQGGIDLIIMDIRMGGISGLETLKKLKEHQPKVPVIIMTAFGTTQTAIESMKFGAYDYILKPFDIPRLQELVEGALALSRTMSRVVHFPITGRYPEGGEGIVGNSAAMQEVYKQIGQVAQSDVTVLLTGERGTGKELVARAIYHHSRRFDRPYMPINCAAIPEGLLESELFGHERGAFTGAIHRKIGKVEQCHGGTLFLDEIGDMPQAIQTKLLRFLQERTFERLGGSEPIRVDVRIIVATNRDLTRLIAEGSFRPDLYDRLNIVHIRLPPLRERREDIPLLVDYFLHRFRGELGRNVMGISKEALRRLMDHTWPGNVRELENLLKRAVVLSRTHTLRSEDILPSPPEPPDQGDDERWRDDLKAHIREIFRLIRKDGAHDSVLAILERHCIAEALQEARGNQSQAARLLRINRNTLRNKIRAYGIDTVLSVREAADGDPLSDPP